MYITNMQAYMPTYTDNMTNGLLFLASPSTYTIPGISIKFLGLPRSDYCFFAPFIRSSFPSIVYPCWDHSARTVLRNLMNNRLTLVCGKLDNTAGFQNYEIADIQDLRKLKLLHPSSSSIRFGDITPEIKQNCDATSRVINEKVVHDLKTYLPGSKGTQLYLIAANCTHEPFRNDRFGPPPLVVHSLWKGLIIWGCWRRYIQLTDGLSLGDNFISRTHYITEELLVHAGINHQLALFLCFPDLSIKEYSLRGTGNRGLEAIHGMFRGGTTSLPITSPNLSFAEFLVRMNKAVQIHTAEHDLKQIPGNTIVASRKKRETCGHRSKSDTDNSLLYQSYTKPSSFEQFLRELNDTCSSGEQAAKEVIQDLAPDIANTLKKHHEWDVVEVSLNVPSSVNLVLTASDFANQVENTESVFTSITMAKLGPAQNLCSTSTSECSDQEYSHALGSLHFLIFKTCVLVMFMG